MANGEWRARCGREAERSRPPGRSRLTKKNSRWPEKLRFGAAHTRRHLSVSTICGSRLQARSLERAISLDDVHRRISKHVLPRHFASVPAVVRKTGLPRILVDGQDFRFNMQRL